MKEEVDFKNKISQRTESAVSSCKNTWDKFVEKNNVSKPQQALERENMIKKLTKVSLNLCVSC